MTPLWSWVFMVIGLTGFFATSTGRRWGWLLNIGVQPLWVVYALVTNQPGFIVMSVLYAWVFTRNYLRTKA